MLGKDFRQRAGHISTYHGRGVHPRGAHWLDPAIAAIEEVQIHRRLGDWFGEMGFHPNPFLGADSALHRRQVQIRPTPGRIYQGPSFNLFAGRDNTERAGAVDTLNRDLLPGVHASALGGAPKSCIKIETGNAGGGGVHANLKSTAIKEEPGERNVDRICYQRGMLTIEEVLEQPKRFRGDKLAADFVARES